MSKSLNIQLLIIDPQNDFLGNADGTPYSVTMSDGKRNWTEIADLPVPGAVEDMQRLAAFIDRVGPKLADIHVTLDSHRVFDVGHASMWIDSQGRPPKKFTIISAADIPLLIQSISWPLIRRQSKRRLLLSGKGLLNQCLE